MEKEITLTQKDIEKCLAIAFAVPESSVHLTTDENGTVKAVIVVAPQKH